MALYIGRFLTFVDYRAYLCRVVFAARMHLHIEHAERETWSILLWRSTGKTGNHRKQIAMVLSSTGLS